MTAQELVMAKVNQMMPRSGQPKRFSFQMETNAKTTQVRPRNTISHRLKAIIVSAGSKHSTCLWRVLGLFGLPWRCLFEGSNARDARHTKSVTLLGTPSLKRLIRTFYIS